MKIGLIGIDSLSEEQHFLNISTAVNNKIYGIFSPKSDDILPFSKNVNAKLFSSASDLFSSVDIIYIANSIKPNFDFAIDAIKKSCHLFIENISQLNIDEIKQLIALALEAGVKIHIKHSKLFYSEYLELSDYFENPKLIEINTSFTSLLRKQDYFNEIFNNLYLADSILKSTIKKTSTIATPINSTHFSLIHIRVDYDNGTSANIKLNNLSSVSADNLTIYQKNEIVDISFIDHFGIMHKFENGKTLRKEFNVENTNAFNNEISYFMNICCKDKFENLSESPSVLNSIRNTFEIMNLLDKVLLNS
jgi:hypothetical protein